MLSARLALLSLTLSLTAVAAFAEDRRVTQLAKQVLTDLQPDSIRRNREYCGLILRDTQDRLVVSKIIRGKRATCRFPNPKTNGTVIATFHTHSAFRRGYDNDVPSLKDFDVMEKAALDGYVSTPGGRFWIIEGARKRVRLICGPGCVPSDRRYDAASGHPLGKIQKTYTRTSLAARGGDLDIERFLCGTVLCTD